MLRTLGELSLEGSRLTRPRPLLLLAYLAVEGRQERRYLAELFWNGTSDPSNRLSTTLTKLRRAGPNVVGADAVQVWAEVDLDAAHFARAVREGRYEDALATYRGPFLAGVQAGDGVELEEWIYATREHYAGLARKALFGLADREAAAGRFEAAAERAEAAASVAGAPELDEEAAARLLLLLKAGDSPRLARFAAEAAEFGVEPPATRAEAERALAGTVAPGRSAPRHNLPALPTGFVGRAAELRRVEELLADPSCRLLTIMAPGGMGKTRLALRVAERRLADFPGGVFFVPFAGSAAHDPWVYPIAEALSLAVGGEATPEARLLEHLAGRRTLLVLDNLEHVLAGVDLLHAVLERAPGVTVLATSRERLGLHAEWIFDLGGMRLPHGDSPDELAASGALALFSQVARRHGRSLTPGDLPLAVEICRRVEGMPLAIELAAGWLGVLDVAEVLAEVVRGIDFLATDTRDVPERQRSIRAAFDLSWERLTPAERDTFARLTVFRGGFSLDSARAVARADLRVLRSLVGKSFVARLGDGRYAVHELLRQYGGERLAASGAEGAVRDEHGGHFLARLAQAERLFKGARQAEALASIEADWRNVRAAWTHALARPDVGLVAASLEMLHLYADVRGRTQEVTALFDRALAALGDGADTVRVRGRLLTRRSFLRLLHQGDDMDALAADLQRGLAVAREAGDVAEAAFATWALGILAVSRDRDLERADELLDASRAMFDQVGDRFFGGRVLNGLGLIRFETRPIVEAKELIERALVWAGEAGGEVERAHHLVNLSDVTLVQGDYAGAEAQLRDAIAVGSSLKLHVLDAYGRSMLAFVLVLRGEVAEAEDQFARAGAILADVGYPSELPVRQAIAGLLALLRGDADEAVRLASASIASPRGFTMGMETIAHWVLALAHAVRREDERSWRHVRAIMAQTPAYGPAVGTWALPVAAVLRAAEGDELGAAVLLALADTHPASPTGWQRHWPHVDALRAGLATRLGPDALAAARARGGASDLAEVLAELAGPERR